MTPPGEGKTMTEDDRLPGEPNGDRTRWPVAAGLLVLLLAETWLVAMLLDRMGDSVPMPRRLLGLPYKGGSRLPLAILVVWTSLVPAVLSAGSVRRGLWVFLLPFVLPAAAVAGWFLIGRSCDVGAMLHLTGAPSLPAARAGIEMMRFVSTYGLCLLAVTFWSLVAAAVLSPSRQMAGKAALAAAMICLPLLGLGQMIVQSVYGDAGSDVLFAWSLSRQSAARIGLVTLVAMNASMLAHLCMRSRPIPLTAALAVTALAGLAGWQLLQTALPRAEDTLGAEWAGQISPTSLILRWCLLQWGAVLALMQGQLAAMHALNLYPKGWCKEAERVKPEAPRRKAERGEPRRRPPATGEQMTLPWAPQGVESKPPSRPGLAYWVLTPVYLAFVIYGSLVPLKYRYVTLARAWEKFQQTPWLSLGRAHRADWVANCLLFIPLTFFAMGVLTKEGRRRRAEWLFAIVLPPLGLALACVVEFTQVYFPLRTRSLNDIAAEGAGALIGVLVWLAFGQRITRWARSLWRERVQGRLAVKILAGYLVVFVVYQFMPFDLTISPAEVWHKLKEGKLVLVPFTDRVGITPYIILIKIALLVPVGYLIWMVSPRGRFWRSAAIGLIVAAGIELGQVFVVSRFASTTDLLLGGAGAMLGSWLASRLCPWARDPWPDTDLWRDNIRWIMLAATVFYLAILLGVHWKPFNFQYPPKGILRTAIACVRPPFVLLYYKAELSALTQLVRRFSSFFVLGLMIRAVAGSSRAGKWWTLSIVWAAAIAIEAGQMFLPQRVPDFCTTSLTLALGGTIGAVLGPWLGEAFLAPAGRRRRAEGQTAP